MSPDQSLPPVAPPPRHGMRARRTFGLLAVVVLAMPAARGETQGLHWNDGLVYRGEGSAAPLDGDNAVNLCDVARETEHGARPAFHWGSWMDAGTAAGLIARFHSVDAPMQVKIGAWNHGAMQQADPFHPDAPLSPTRQQQVDEIARFFRERLAGAPLAPRKAIAYYTMGEEIWSQTEVWPPCGVETARLYLAANQALSDAPPTGEGEDAYTVDSTATTGQANRWTTQVGTEIHYGDRRDADAKLLTYTAAPLDAPLTLTGTPQGQRLDGAITVPQGEYVTRLDLDSLIGGGASNLGGAGFNLGGTSTGRVCLRVSGVHEHEASVV